MKKFYLIVFFFFGLISVFSQTQITLTFMGKDSVTQNLISLDSVYVKNLTENCDTLLYGPVPVLSLIATWPVGIGEINANSSGAFILKQNYPNPFQGSTFVNIYREYRGALNLILFDELGTKLAEYQNEFEKGFHSFVISSSGNKVMILVVFDDKNNRSIKIISAGQGNENNTIQYFGQTQNVEKSSLKNPDNSGFIFYLGNQLMYTAYANGYNEKTIIDNPTYDSTYYFNMSMFYLPTVITSPVTDITQTTATSGGNVTSDGGATVTARGVCWNTSSNPTTANSYTTDGSGTGTFVSNLTSLTPNTLYYVRAYATNSVGTSYGNELSFTTLTPPFICGDIVSYEGKTYKTVQIGTQCWFKENLNVGTRINGSQDQSNCDVYGGLYQWNEMMQYSTTPGVQGICPTGWHLPTDAEWTVLTDYLGGENVAGGKMKEAGTSHWNVPNTGATNSSGFTALPGGGRGSTGSFYSLTTNADFWSSTEHLSIFAWYRYLDYSSELVYRNYFSKTNGFSARCVQD
jgi:uncharacterized protein (TIGR02145 family)